MRIQIDTANNGYLITTKKYLEDGTIEENEYTVVEDEEDEFVGCQKLLWNIMDILGVYNSKHKDKRLSVEIIDQKPE